MIDGDKKASAAWYLSIISLGFFCQMGKSAGKVELLKAVVRANPKEQMPGCQVQRSSARQEKDMKDFLPWHEEISRWQEASGMSW